MNPPPHPPFGHPLPLGGGEGRGEGGGYPVSSRASAWKSTKPYFHAKWYPERDGGFMGSEHLQNSDVNRGDEPVGIPLNRPPGSFSPTGGEGRDEGVGSWKALFRFSACI